MNFKLSAYAFILPVSDGTEGPTAKRVIYSARRGMGITISDYALQLIIAGNYQAIPDGLFSTLVHYELIIPEDEDELKEIVRSNKMAVTDISGQGAGRITLQLHIITENEIPSAISSLSMLEDNQSGNDPVCDIAIDITLVMSGNYAAILPVLLPSLTALCKYEQVNLQLELRREEKEEMTDYADREKEFLQYLSGCQLYVNLLPAAPALQYRTQHTQHYYDDQMEEALLKGKCSCAHCHYLPLCGGKIDKWPEDNSDCPSFTRHFTEKILLKYGLPLTTPVI